MNPDALSRAALLAGIELAVDLPVLLVVYLNPRSPPGRVSPPRRAGAMRPVAAIAAAHAVQWSGVCAVALAGLAPRSAVSLGAFAVLWSAGLWGGSALLRRALMSRCEMDAASAREIVIAKLAVHGAVWLVACVYARVML